MPKIIKLVFLVSRLGLIPLCLPYLLFLEGNLQSWLSEDMPLCFVKSISSAPQTVIAAKGHFSMNIVLKYITKVNYHWSKNMGKSDNVISDSILNPHYVTTNVSKICPKHHKFIESERCLQQHAFLINENQVASQGAMSLLMVGNMLMATKKTREVPQHRLQVRLAEENTNTIGLLML